MINLIASSIRTHFILDPKRKDKLISDDNYEDSSLMSVIIFVGLCHQHAIDREDVKIFLGMEDAEYNGKMTKFMDFMDDVHDRITKGNIMKHRDIVYRFYAKYTMCLRYISTKASRHQGKDLYVWRNILLND